MSVYQRGETLYHWITLRNRNQTLVDPTSIKITISNPCGTVAVDAQNMTQDSTGVYYYAYDIPADGVYGEWDIKVVAVDGGDNSVFKDKMYLLPWDAVDQVRELSGITSKKSVSDDAIARIIWEAYLEALDTVYVGYYGEKPKCNPDTGAWIDGTNTSFALTHIPLADRYGDGAVTGYGELSCSTDVSGVWVDSDGEAHLLKITVTNALGGLVTLTQLDGSALPSDLKSVKVDYWAEWRTYNERLFRLSVAYLAAHKCIVRFQELDKATLADLYSNREMITRHFDRMMKEYTKAMNKIRRPVVGGGMLPGE